jgi:hypothetical protein
LRDEPDPLLPTIQHPLLTTHETPYAHVSLVSIDAIDAHDVPLQISANGCTTPEAV